MNTDVTLWMQNISVYPKSTQDEAYFAFIGSIVIPCSTQHSTCDLTSFRKLQRFPETASQVNMNINFSTAARGKLHGRHIISRWELIPCLWLKRWPNFPQAVQVELSLSNRYVRGTLCFLSQVERTVRGPDSKEGRISLKWLKLRLIFHLTRWRHVWIPWENLEKAVGVRVIWTGGLTCLWTL